MNPKCFSHYIELSALIFDTKCIFAILCAKYRKEKKFKQQFIYIFEIKREKTIISESILRFLTSFRVFGYWRRFFSGTSEHERIICL